ncbi:MAG: flagellar basal body P-ring protein FlgI [Deltaproteobacteria bacterium]|nr:flagellar basal body P-ring protein FlgI [Deltaproteobacteria bacterium]
MSSHRLISLLIAAGMILAASGAAHAVRLKDVANVEGVRSNKLIGYGLVTGLSKTGDGNSVKFTKATMANVLENMGVTVDPKDIKSGNVASVMVTADLPPFSRAGSRINVTVSAIGDAKSLQGGTLLLTPLRGPDGNTYAVAQGAVSVGGFAAEANGTSVSKNHTTAGMIPDGAIIEREIPFDFNSQEEFSIALNTGDFSTVSQTAARINSEIGPGVATAVDARTIRISVPEQYRTHLVSLMARIENMEIIPDTVARVVLNERTGTVVIGANVQISTVAVSHGNLHIKIQTATNVSQPNAFSGGQTVVTQESAVQAAEQDRKLFVVESGATIGDLVRALNAVGVTPRDLVSILQSIKAAGALQAQLEII